MALIIFLVFSLLIHVSLGDIVCEELGVEMCAYSVDSSGKRCSLETYASNKGTTGYECKTSGVGANINMAEWIETDECIDACGADRRSVGISSDSLLESKFTSKLCSKECYQNCPNMVDLFYNLALGEGTCQPNYSDIMAGVYLPAFCKGKQINGRREMSQLKSSATAWPPVFSTNGRQLGKGPAVGAAVTFDDWAPAPLASFSALKLIHGLLVGLRLLLAGDTDQQVTCHFQSWTKLPCTFKFLFLSQVSSFFTVALDVALSDLSDPTGREKSAKSFALPAFPSIYK